MDEEADIVKLLGKRLTIAQRSFLQVAVNVVTRNPLRPVAALLPVAWKCTPFLWSAMTPSRTQKPLSPTTTFPVPCSGFVISIIVFVVF